jgi:hypothetical protein
MIATFTATPNSVASGKLTFITWTWTYSNTPAPAPTCTIDHGVGSVTSGQSTPVTLTTATTYTLTCTNSGGSAMAQATITIAIPPIITGFVATPSLIPFNTPNTVTWTWSYSNSPAPAPTCSIEFGIGAVTSGSTSSVTQTTARTYRLTCTNNGGSGTADATISVDDCAAGLANCDAHASCVDTVESFTCACNAGYTGDGATCSALEACNSNPTLCDPNAACTNTADGYACICKPGYVGDGTTCSRLRIAFTTSTSGTGALSTWADAGGKSGLAAADAVCAARAAAAGLPGTYVAWLSDSTSDAYCRVYGFTGKKAALCGQSTLPAAPGPWARTDGQPFAGTLDRLMAPYLDIDYPADLDETGALIAAGAQVYTGTDINGVLENTPCTDWTTAANASSAIVGRADGGGRAWTDNLMSSTCDTALRIRCLETGSGPPLVKRPPPAKRVFVTSVKGTGKLSTWTDSGGLDGLAGADAVCAARARYIGIANAPSFKAFLSATGASAASRMTANGPWYRLDGIPVAFSKADLIDAAINAAINVTEILTAPSTTFQSVWTGSDPMGALYPYTCGDWATGASTIYGGTGKYDYVDARWVESGITSCNATEALYCFEQ